MVSSPAKIGKDAGELASPATKMGILATNRIDDIIATAPRVVCSAAGGVVNAIPAVAAAPPGIISMLDLPFYGATAAYHP